MNSSKPTLNRINSNANSQRDRRKSIAIISILFGSVVGFVILALVFVVIFSGNDEQTENKNSTYIFHEANYEYDIMKDAQYLELDRQIYFSNPETGLTIAIDKENHLDVPSDQKEYVLLLCDFIEYAINGKTNEFNSLFSEEYIEAEGKIKLDFTMQQLYNIKITYVQTTAEVVEGNTHTSYDYWLEYMIRNNNGTFRSDMESDCTRKEYVRVTKRENKIGIDVLAPYTTEQRKNEIIGIDEIVKISIVAVITIGAVIAFSIIVKKKNKIYPTK